MKPDEDPTEPQSDPVGAPKKAISSRERDERRESHERRKSRVSAAEHTREKLLDLARVVDREAARITTDPGDDEAVHDLRVAIRRLRTLLEAARPLFGKWRSDTVRKAFTDVMRATGELRDEEVLEALFAQASDAPEFVAWARARTRRAKALRRRVVAILEGGAIERATTLLDALVAFPVRPGRDRPLEAFALRTVQHARRGVEHRKRLSSDDPEALHELRIAHKKLRYRVELFLDVLPEKWRKILDFSTLLQKRLGDVHDVDVAIAIVNDAGAAKEADGQRTNLGSRARKKALGGLERLRRKRVRKVLRLTPLDTLQDTRHARLLPKGSLRGRRLL